MSYLKYIIIFIIFNSCVTQTAESYYAQGKNEAIQTNDYVAIQKYTKAIKLNPNYINAYMDRAKSFMAVDSIRNAIRDYDSVLVKIDINSYEKRGQLYLIKGDAYFVLSEDSLACGCYEKSKFLGNTQSWDRIRNLCRKK